MYKIKFYKRDKEKNIRKIKLMYKEKCIKIINFSEYQLFQILSDVVTMLERGDSKEIIRDYAVPYMNLYSSSEELNLDDLVIENTEEVEKYKNMYEELEKNHSRQVKTIENLNKKINELEQKLKVKSKIVPKSTNRGNKKTKKEDLDIGDILKEGPGI